MFGPLAFHYLHAQTVSDRWTPPPTSSLLRRRYTVVSFTPNRSADADFVIKSMTDCISDVRSWMIWDNLMSNDDKTEFLIIGASRKQLKNHNLIFSSRQKFYLWGQSNPFFSLISPLLRTLSSLRTSPFVHYFLITKVSYTVIFDAFLISNDSNIF